jgi:hypothetical protein
MKPLLLTLFLFSGIAIIKAIGPKQDDPVKAIGPKQDDPVKVIKPLLSSLLVLSGIALFKL